VPRNRAWVDNLTGYIQSTILVTTDLLASATINLDTITVTRLILDLYATPETPASNTSGTSRIDFGIGVITEAAFDAGSPWAQVPDPRVGKDTPARGWLWRGIMVVGFQNIAGDERENWNLVGHVRADLGAMRKVDKGKLVLITAKTALQGSVQDWDISGLIRTLCLT